MTTTMRRTAAAVLAAAAVAAPSASASFGYVADSSAGEQTDSSQPVRVLDHSALDASLNPIAPSSGSEPAFVSGSPSAGDGFDWGDAGLGAAATLGLLGLSAGAVAVARRGRAARAPAVS